MDTPPNSTPNSSNIRQTTSDITWTNRCDHFVARWSVKRSEHKISSGLYQLGTPTKDSPVFVTANYTLSFDALRSALAGFDGYILVLDTRGVNVWCAAGKRTFDTNELVHQIETTGLQDVVTHRVLILPQLGAPGVAAHEVRKRSGFKVEYGPVRADDLPEYLKTRQATPEMRRVRFPLTDRLFLAPVELVHYLPHMLITALIFFFVDGFRSSVGAIVAIMAGTLLFPILLPWLPTRDFSTKGLILGLLVMFPFTWMRYMDASDTVLWIRVGQALIYLLALPPITAYLSLNFTGSSTFTSQTGVKREIYLWVPIMVALVGIGFVLTIIFKFV